LLTLDTHHPNGFKTPSCSDTIYGDGSNDILQAVACADKLVGNFINKIQHSPYARDTVIVIASDHLAMQNTATYLLKKGNRTNRLMILDLENPVSEKIDLYGTTYNTGTTLLPFLGFEGVIGLGRDMLNDTYREQDAYHIDIYTRFWKPDIQQFFNFPQIQKNLYIDPINETIQIDEREFSIPVLITLDDALHTSLNFDPIYDPQLETYAQQIKKQLPEQTFLYIGHCDELSYFDTDLVINEKNYCMIAGDSNNIYHSQNIDEPISMTIEQLKSLYTITP